MTEYLTEIDQGPLTLTVHFPHPAAKGLSQSVCRSVLYTYIIIGEYHVKLLVYIADGEWPAPSISEDITVRIKPSTACQLIAYIFQCVPHSRVDSYLPCLASLLFLDGEVIPVEDVRPGQLQQITGPETEVAPAKYKEVKCEVPILFQAVGET